MSPVLLAALITQVGVPELMRWLASLHAANTVITEAVILQKLGMDVDTANTIGQSFLDSHPKTTSGA